MNTERRLWKSSISTLPAVPPLSRHRAAGTVLRNADEEIRGLCAYVLLETDSNKVVGFCSLNPYNPFTTFKSTVTITYFIDREYVGKGLGTQCLAKLEEDARKLGVHNIIAEISSENNGSIRFHDEHGFKIVGTLKDIGEKLGKVFGVVYMQKTI